MRLREQSHFYHIQETISIFKHGIAVFQALVIDGSLAADELGADTGGQHDGLTNVVLLETDGDGHLLQMHADQRAADVEARIGLDLLQRHGMAEAVIGGGGKGAAGLRLGHYIDDFPVGDSLMLHNQGAVQMLTALSGDVNAHGSKYAAQSLKDSVCHLGCGPAAHIVSHYFAGGASNYHNLTLV